MASGLQLLGQPRLADSELPPTKPVYLLLYLAYSGEWVGREALAELFAPESDEEAARRTLRVLLNRAKALTWAEGLEVEPSRLRWQVPTDVRTFREAVGRGDWPLAVRLHQHQLLEGFPIKDAPGFEAWLELERQSLLGAWREAALRCGLELGLRGQHAQAAQLLLQLLHHDPLAEDVLAAYLQQAYLSGQREDALSAYSAFAKHIRSELGLEPLERTQKLVEQIRRVEPLALPAADTVPTIPLKLLRPPSLVGREAEQQRLLSSAQALTLVAGEPGVGKTRLLSETFPQAEVLACREGLENLPFYPVLEYLKPRLAGLPNLGAYREDLARLIPELMPSSPLPPSDPHSAKLRLLEALARALEGSRVPLMFDDLQWADSATLELLVLLATRGKRRLLGTYRKGEVAEPLGKALAALRGGRNLLEINLGPLSKAAIKNLLASLIGLEQGPPLFSEWLHRRSGGNMFFALETLKALFENGSLRVEGSGWSTPLDQITHDYSELEVPGRIAELMQRRMAGLSEPTQRVLQTACVVRGDFEARLLGSVAGLSELAVVEALEEAEAAGLVRGERFAHDLARQSLYAVLPLPRRKLLHRLWAEVLQGQAEASVVADHWLEAGRPVEAASYYHRAAHSDLGHGQHASAIAHFRRCLELGGGQAGRLEVLVDLGVQLIFDNTQESAQTLEQALAMAQQAGRTDLEAQCLGGLLEAAVFAGDKPTTEHWLSQARALKDAEIPTPRKVALLESLIEAALRDGGYAQAQDYLRQALELEPEAVSLGAFEAQIHYYRGQFAQAKRVFEGLIARNPQWVRVLSLENDLGMACLMWGALPEAVGWLERSIENWSGVPHIEALSRSNLGLAHLEGGRLEAAMAQLEQAHTLAQDFGSKTFLADVLHRKGGVWFAAGQFDLSLACCTEAVALARAVDDPFRLGYTLAATAALHTLRQEPAVAHQLLAEAEALQAWMNHPVVEVLLGRTAFTLAQVEGDPVRAAHHLERWLEAAHNYQMRHQLAWARLAQAALPQTAEPEAVLREALALARDTQAAPAQTLAAQKLGELLQDSALLREAEEIGKELEQHRLNLMARFS